MITQLPFVVLTKFYYVAVICVLTDAACQRSGTGNFFAPLRSMTKNNLIFKLEKVLGAVSITTKCQREGGVFDTPGLAFTLCVNVLSYDSFAGVVSC